MSMGLIDIALLVLVAALWGFNFVVIKIGIANFPPILFSALRFLFAALPLVFFLPRPSVPWRLILGIGLVLGVVKFSLLFIAMDVGLSAGLASLLVLRELNRRLDAAGSPITGWQYERVVKHMLAKRGLVGRRDEPRLGYDTDWVVERGDRDRERLRALEPLVAGDLEDLRCRPIEGVSPSQVSVEQRLEAALDAAAYAVVALARRARVPGSDADNSG